MTDPIPHGTGWAGVPRYVARERLRWQMAHRRGRIDGLHSAAVEEGADRDALLDEADRLEAEQAADADLLAKLLADTPPRHNRKDHE